MLAVKLFASNEFFGLEWDEPLSRKEKTLSATTIGVHDTVSVP
jgi:hypothetical protein